MKTDSSLIGIVTISNCTMKHNDGISTAILIQNFYIPKTPVEKVRLKSLGQSRNAKKKKKKHLCAHTLPLSYVCTHMFLKGKDKNDINNNGQYSICLCI